MDRISGKGKKPKFFVELSIASDRFAPLFGRTGGFSVLKHLWAKE
jgi:hypothetical protein